MRASDDSSRCRLGDLAPEVAEAFVSVASDIALVMDRDGTIRSVAIGAESPVPTAASWIGRPWVETVAEPSRRKIARMLDEVAVSGVSRRSEVEHLLPSGASVPVAYSAVRLGADGPVLAVGRDLRSVAAIQQRFVQAQQQMERDHWKRRDAESRYRLMFLAGSDAVLVVDAGTLKVVESNPAAVERFGLSAAALVGVEVAELFDPQDAPALSEMLEAARAGGRPGEVRARLAGGATPAEVAATRFHAGGTDLLRVRVRAVAPGRFEGSEVIGAFLARTPDAIAITDCSGRVLLTNPAFAALCGARDADALRGRPLADWLDDPRDDPCDERAGARGADLLAEVRRLGSLRRATATVRCPTKAGAAVPVELSAALLSDGAAEWIGFTLRPADGRSGPPEA